MEVVRFRSDLLLCLQLLIMYSLYTLYTVYHKKSKPLIFDYLLRYVYNF